LRTTRMYDSLMQMGRWFGYRPGYADLCRLYTTSQLVNWYRHVTMATEEMRNDFDEMAASNMVPSDYQLKVRTHPGMLMVTSLTKMREHEKIQVGYSGKTIQMFDFNRADLAPNYSDFKYLLSRLSSPETKSNRKGVNGLIWRSVDSTIITDFLSTYRNEYHRLDIIKLYIQKQVENGIFDKWSVALSLNSKTDNTRPVKWVDGEMDGGLSSRTIDQRDPVVLKVGGGKNAILFPEHKVMDLNVDLIPKTEAKIKALRKKSGTPLLVLIPMDSSKVQGVDDNIPIIGFGLIFPQIDTEKKFEYAARPLNLQFEEEPQQSDDTADDEN